MANLSLRTLLSPKSGSSAALTAICQALGNGIFVVDSSGKPLLGDKSTEAAAAHARVPVTLEDATLGFVAGPAAQANAVALLLTHMAARERESRAMAAEVLHLYREVHLIEQLSEQLVALLNLSAVADSALA